MSHRRKYLLTAAEIDIIIKPGIPNLNHRKGMKQIMKMIDVGKSGLSASAVGIGCMRISELSVREVETLIRTALAAGINLFDHADIYGGGMCETLFGEALAGRPELREKMVIQSKCGIRKGYYDLSKEHILSSVDGSLQRLNTDYLDILLLHRPDTLMEPEEIGEAFDQLAATGKVRYFGVSNMNPAQIELIQSAVGQRLIVNQMQFSLARSGMVDSGIHANVPSDQDSRDESVLEYCRLKDITIQTWSPLQYGFFEGTFVGSEKFPQLNDRLNALAEQYTVTPGAIAIAWILRHPAKMQVICGSKNVRRISEIASASVELTRQEWYELYCAAGNVLP